LPVEKTAPVRGKVIDCFAADLDMTSQSTGAGAGSIVAIPRVGGLHHRYERIAA
jgi:hypothetical protein